MNFKAMSKEENIPEERSKKVNETISPEQIIIPVELSNQTSDIPKSEIENMEVHHHPHVEKKNFKEYFLEFIMIFLAVTLHLYPL
jgi:hypothetical protein